MSRRPSFPMVLLLALAALPAAAAKKRRHHRGGGNAPVLTLDRANNYSLAATQARAAAASSPDGPALNVKIRLSGGGGKSWVSESCNPVVPVVNGEMRPLRQCFTDFYAKVVLDQGHGEPVEFAWPLGDPQRPLKPGDRVRLMMTLGSDCAKSTGPGLFAFGDCKIREQILSPAFVIRK